MLERRTLPHADILPLMESIVRSKKWIKQDILLKNFAILSKNPLKNSDALQATISRLCEVNPAIAIRCWHDLIQDNLDDILSGVSDGEFEYGSLGYSLIHDFDSNVIGEDCFRDAVAEFASDKKLLEMVLTLCPISEYTRIYYPIGYLMRHRNLRRADAVLAAIYKNKTFNAYSNLWKEIVDTFHYSGEDHYSGGGIVSDYNYKQPKEV